MTVDAYVSEVLRRLPVQLIDRQTVELDLRMHLLDRMEAGETEESAVRHMGTPEETAAELMSGVVLEPASFGRRAGAYVLDLCIGAIPLVALCLLFLSAQLGGSHFVLAMTEGPGLLFVVLMVTFAVVALATAALSVLYFPVLEALWGQTVGKRLLGMVVVRENGTAIGWVAAIVRRLPFLLEFFMIDALFALFTARRQRAFDKVAGTVVVMTRRA
ncbi:MAG TPA: RDD family protein [Longimicrobiales bacterium]|nr:RDD family protein [Longimicrobiales bacterium]